MPESKYWIKPASWRLTDLACRPARSNSSRLRCSLAISRLPSRSSTKSYCREEQTGDWQFKGWHMAPPASPQRPANMLLFWPRLSSWSREARAETNLYFFAACKDFKKNYQLLLMLVKSDFFGDKWPTNLLHVLREKKHQLKWVCSHDFHVNYRWELTF